MKKKDVSWIRCKWTLITILKANNENCKKLTKKENIKN